MGESLCLSGGRLFQIVLCGAIDFTEKAAFLL